MEPRRLARPEDPEEAWGRSHAPFANPSQVNPSRLPPALRKVRLTPPVSLLLVSSHGMPKTLGAVYVLLLVLVGPACGRGGADFVFRGGGVYTLDGDRPWAESVVVDGGRIAAVGSDAETARYIGRGTEVIDLEGKMLLPGFQDSHTHPILGATLKPDVGRAPRP